MKPFAMKSGGRPQLHWWVIAGFAAAFFVWNFDLIPRIRSAATGTVAQSKAKTARNAGNEDATLPLDGDWSPEVLDSADMDLADMDSRETSLASDDPLLSDFSEDGLVDFTEPGEEAEGGDSSEGRNSHRPIRDPRVTAAGYESNEFDTSAKNQFNRPGQVIPADVATQLRNVDEWFRDDLILEAHAELSKIYWKHPELREFIQERIDHTATLIFTTTERQFGPPHFVEYGETLETIARQYDVPWKYLAMLNRVTPERLQAGQELKVVRGPFGAVVDLSEFTLTVHAHGWYVNHYRIGTGRDHKTPLGAFVVQEKLENPTWYNPDGGIVEPDDPANPLGEYWLGLGNHIGIHGTNDPGTIGKAASRGCIHLGDDDIAEVFSLLGPGSKVIIRK